MQRISQKLVHHIISLGSHSWVWDSEIGGGNALLRPGNAGSKRSTNAMRHWTAVASRFGCCDPQPMPHAPSASFIGNPWGCTLQLCQYLYEPLAYVWLRLPTCLFDSTYLSIGNHKSLEPAPLPLKAPVLSSLAPSQNGRATLGHRRAGASSSQSARGAIDA